MFLSIVIPAYNEEERILETLAEVIDYLKTKNYTHEIIVVDDGSNDGTSQLIKKLASQESNLSLLENKINEGKGFSVRRGMLAARGDLIIFMDADNATPFDQITLFLEKIKEGYDAVIASRYLKDSKILKKQGLFRRLMSRGGNLLFRIVLGLQLTDTRCGFKLFKKEAAKKIFSLQRLKRWGFDTEILLIAKINNLRVGELPVSWYDKKRGKIKPLRDSINSMIEIFKIKCNALRGRYHFR